MNASIHFRADHDLVARVIAEKLRRRTDRTRIEDGFRVDPPPAEARRAN
jgi:hypothetical protein